MCGSNLEFYIAVCNLLGHIDHTHGSRPTGMARIAVTGATGNVGREVIEAFEPTDHELSPISRTEYEDIDTQLLDVEDRERFVDLIEGHDILIHLAANPSPDAEWDAVVGPNIEGTYNAYEAAVRNSLDRVVFASTNHVVNMYTIGDPTESESMREGPVEAIHPEVPPLPDSYYGVSKVAGEALGNLYAHREGLEVVNLRIGWLQSTDQLADNVDDPGVESRFARAMFLSPRDCQQAILAASTAELPENSVTVNVVSRNDTRFLSLTESHQQIGYRPRDNAAEILADRD